MTIHHEHRCERIDRRNDPEDDERGARHAPETFSICAQRRTEHFPRQHAAVHLPGSDDSGHPAFLASITASASSGNTLLTLAVNHWPYVPLTSRRLARSHRRSASAGATQSRSPSTSLKSIGSITAPHPGSRKKGNEYRSAVDELRARCGVDRYRPPVRRSSMSPRLQTISSG